MAAATMLAGEGTAVAYGKLGYCRGDDDCPAPFTLCTTSLGGCGHAAAPLQMCTGSCVDPETWHFAARAGFVGVWDGGANPGVVASVELAPPILNNILSVAADIWSQHVWRFGGALSLPASNLVLLGARLDATKSTNSGHWGASAALRGQVVFVVGDATTAGILVEVGAFTPSSSQIWPFVILNVGFWAWRPGH